MNALQFFDWGFENKKYKEAKLKKESDKILNELRTSPIDRSWYYRVGNYWYRYTYTNYNGSVYNWTDMGRNDIDELVPYFSSASILYLINCNARKITFTQITLDGLLYEIHFSNRGEDGINDRNTIISIPPKYGNNITVLKGNGISERSYINFNTTNLIGKQPHIEVGIFEDPEKLRRKIIIE